MQEIGFSQVSAELRDILRADTPDSEHILHFLVRICVTEYGSAKLPFERGVEATFNGDDHIGRHRF